MPTLKELKQKIGSVSKTRRMTDAMNKISISMLRKANVVKDSSAVTLSITTHMLNVLFARYKSQMMQIVPFQPNGALLLVVMTTNRGLAGAVNTSVLKKITAYPQAKLFVIGQRGQIALKKNSQVIESMRASWKDVPTSEDLKNITEDILHIVSTTSISNVAFVYPGYISSMVQKPKMVYLYENDFELTHVTEQINHDDMHTLKTMFITLIQYCLQAIAAESFLSEQASRVVAMENATHNADDMLEKLQISYNRIRQAKITREIIEIVTGANALNESK